MAEDGPSDAAEAAWQRHLTSLVLARVGAAGFALAGSGAIREHGITDRPTRDVDLFTTTATSPADFASAVAEAQNALTRQGYRVTRVRATPEFARLLVEVRSTDDEGKQGQSRGD